MVVVLAGVLEGVIVPVVVVGGPEKEWTKVEVSKMTELRVVMGERRK